LLLIFEFLHTFATVQQNNQQFKFNLRNMKKIILSALVLLTTLSANAQQEAGRITV
jgi:hypothetical protein